MIGGGGGRGQEEYHCSASVLRKGLIVPLRGKDSGCFYSLGVLLLLLPFPWYWIEVTKDAALSVPPTAIPTVAPTSTARTPRMCANKSIVLEAAEYASIGTTVEALKDEESPQHSALQWLVDEDETFHNFNDASRLVQQFVLATLYSATVGKELWKKALRLSFEHDRMRVQKLPF